MGIIKDLFATPKMIGAWGERKIVNRLGLINLFGKNGKTLRNVYIPKEDGSTTEIDALYITTKGLFVIESKNFSGYIFGNENNRNWTATLYAGKTWYGAKKVEKHHFYNPIWQNNSHINVLKKFLKMNIPMFSIVVFSSRCEIKELVVEHENAYICKADTFLTLFQGIWNAYPCILDDLQVYSIYEQLEPLTNQDRAIKEKHIAEVRARLESEEKCPLCGGQLVLRTARQGTNAGHQFVGCSNYPRCRYTRNL